VIWATLKLNITPNPTNPSDAVFDGLADFIKAVIEEDKQIMVFTYNLSEYTTLKELPPFVNDVEMLPEEVNDWLKSILKQNPTAKEETSTWWS